MAIHEVRLPDPPPRFFASDNASGVHRRYLEAISRANTDHALAYGDDAFTSSALEVFRDLSGTNIEALICFGGTGANVTALSILLDRAESVICTSQAHIAVDETGAPERILGVKLQTVETIDGKLQPEHIHTAAQFVESFTDGLWLETAAHANAMARTLFDSLSDVSSLGLKAPAVNSLYPTLHDPAKSILQDWCFFWDWDLQEHTVRWMTSWDTKPLMTSGSFPQGFN